MKPKKITRITRNWQVTIPKNLRKGLRVGDYVVIESLRKVKLSL